MGERVAVIKVAKVRDIITIANGAAWSIEFYTKGGYFDTRKKSLETRSEDFE